MDALTRATRLFDFTPPQPRTFASAEAAWLWTMGVLCARRDGEPGDDPTGIADEVVKTLDRLYRQRKVDLAHARILRIWGELGEAPPPLRRHDDDVRLWSEAMAAMEWPLRARGIVRGNR